MDKNSTQFLSYDQIKTDKTDIYEDAFGLVSEFSEVTNLIIKSKPLVSDELTFRLMAKLRREL